MEIAGLATKISMRKNRTLRTKISMRIYSRLSDQDQHAQKQHPDSLQLQAGLGLAWKVQTEGLKRRPMLRSNIGPKGVRGGAVSPPALPTAVRLPTNLLRRKLASEFTT